MWGGLLLYMAMRAPHSSSSRLQSSGCSFTSTKHSLSLCSPPTAAKVDFRSSSVLTCMANMIPSIHFHCNFSAYLRSTNQKFSSCKHVPNHLAAIFKICKLPVIMLRQIRTLESFLERLKPIATTSLYADAHAPSHHAKKDL